MKHDVIDMKGKVVRSVDLDDSVWAIEPNVPVMHQALVRQLANARHGTADTKTRAQVRGGGRKPWRQKGTGRARHGSIRSPIWVGGGVAFGPHPRKYTKRMPRKMRRLAVRSALSAKARDNRVAIVDGLEGVEAKTKAMIDVIASLPEARSYLIVLPEKTESVERSTGNIENVSTILASYLNVRDLLKYDHIVVMKDSVTTIEGILALSAEQQEPSEWKKARTAAAAEESAHV